MRQAGWSVAVGAATGQDAGDGDRARLGVEQQQGAPVTNPEAVLGSAGELAQRAGLLRVGGERLQRGLDALVDRWVQAS